MPIPVLDLGLLGAGMLGISPRFGAALAEAAVVCLESQAHACGVGMTVKGDFVGDFSVRWDAELDSQQAARTWGDPEVATEHGAYGIAALLVCALTEWTVLERSRKGTGFDYWLGPKDSPEPLFQGKAKMEVSGIRHGSLASIESRIKQKLKQVSGAKPSKRAAIVVVVEFGLPTSHMVNG